MLTKRLVKKGVARLKPELVSKNTFSLKWFGGLLAAWLVVMAGLFSLPNYNQLLPLKNPFVHLPTFWFLLIGFIALVGVWKKVPLISENQWDISPRAARFWFWVLILLALYIRVFDLSRPVSCVGEDHYIHTSDIRHILDYGWYPLLFPSGWREPLFPYLTACMWYFTPQTPGLVIVQLSNVVIDLAALWIFYLLGKEIGGRRMGVLYLGMGAICKEMITITKVEMGNDTCVLAGALTLLFFMRVLKKPDLKHFILWGMAMGFGALTYIPFRPWVPVVLGVMWLWVFSDLKERHFDFDRVVLGPLFLLEWAFLFLFRNSFLPEHNRLVDLLGSYPSLLLAIFLLVLSYLRVFKREKEKGFSKLLGWATGALVTAVVMTPFYLSPDYSSHVSQTSAFGNAHSLSMDFGILWGNIQSCMLLLFGKAGWVANIPAAGDSFYDFFVPACALLGLAYFIARPYWVSAFVSFLFVVSMVPGVLSTSPHSQRLVACTTPLLLMGAWGIHRFWLAALQAKSNKVMRIIYVLVLLAFGGWILDKSYETYEHWMEHWSGNGIVADVVTEELPTHRVYLVGYYSNFYTWTQDVLSDGKPVYQMFKTNPIDLIPGEQGKDLAILVSAEDKENQKKIEHEFPGIAWKQRPILSDVGQSLPFLLWIEVPFSRVAEHRSGLFDVEHVSTLTWRRRFYDRYGIGRGLILYEDRVIHWNDKPILSVLNDLNTCCSMRIKGDWNIQTGGNYILTSNTANPFWLLLDGKKILQVSNHEGLVLKKYKVFLEPGIHHVELVVGFVHERMAPLVTAVAPGTSTEIPLDEFAAEHTVNSSKPVSAL